MKKYTSKLLSKLLKLRVPINIQDELPFAKVSRRGRKIYYYLVVRENCIMVRAYDPCEKIAKIIPLTSLSLKLLKKLLSSERLPKFLLIIADELLKKDMNYLKVLETREEAMRMQNR